MTCARCGGTKTVVIDGVEKPCEGCKPTQQSELYYLIGLLNSKWVIGDMEGFDDALERLYRLRNERR